MRPTVGLLAALIVVFVGPVTGQDAAGGPSLEVAGTLFRVRMPSGRILTSSDLLGATLTAADEVGAAMTVRIEEVRRDPSDAGGDIWLHRFSVLDAATGTWSSLCVPGPDGTAAGFPLAGSWTADGRHVRDPSNFTIACTSGAAGKCVRLGYKPWHEAGGEALWDYHQTCVRVLRADYGGDGVAHTREGTSIDLFDRLGIQRPESDLGGRTFEAAWRPDGAVCIQRTRVPELLPADELAQRYPRLTGKIGPDCSEATPALIWNRS